MDKIDILKNISKEDLDIEIELFLFGLYLKHGYDFRNYSKAHVERRIVELFVENDFDNFAQMQHAMIYDNIFQQKVLVALSINYTEMYRNPLFYKSLRDNVIPILKTFPFVKIWNAGCSSGEEVYSLAILLKEEGIYDKCQIYATDFNKKVLNTAKEGIYHIEKFKNYSQNYILSGGKYSLSKYYTAKYDHLIFDKSLKENIVFAEHNLVSDSDFAEMNLILCRNVLIYFDKSLQNKTIKLFSKSLCYGGILCIGDKENLEVSNCYKNFEGIDKENKIYKYVKYD